MPEHQIRLRAAWTLEADGRSSRVDLPADRASIHPSGPFRLVRSFRLPEIGPDESLFIELQNVPGLVAVRLDSRLLAEVQSGVDSVSCPLPDRPTGRAILCLDVDPSLPALGAIGEGSPWGWISLAIRS